MFNIHTPFDRKLSNLPTLEEILADSKRQVLEALKDIKFYFEIKSFSENENPAAMNHVGQTITVQTAEQLDAIKDALLDNHFDWIYNKH